MRSDCLQDVYSIIRQFSKHEINAAKGFLMAFDQSGNKEKNKVYQLFIHLLNTPEATYQETRRHFGISVDKKSFDQLCRRLKEKLIESLILDINIKRKDAYSDWHACRMDIRKKFMQAFILISRGVEKESFGLFHKIVERAKMFELYSELHEVLHWMRNELGLREGEETYDKYTADLEFYRYCNEAVFRARDIYYRYFIKEEGKHQAREEQLATIKAAISELTEMYQKTTSANVGYYLYLLKMEYSNAQQQYDESCKIGLRLIDLIEKNPAIYMDTRLGVVYSELAENYQYLGDYQQSLQYAQKALEFVPPQSFSFEVVKEIEFRAHFYAGNYQQAQQILVDTERAIGKKGAAIQRWKREYFKATLLFTQNKFKASLQMFNTFKKWTKDTENWNVWVRIMTIMNLVELEKYDLADRNIEALRKYIQRTHRTTPVKERYLIISRLLLQLEKRSFNFEEVMGSHGHYIDHLEAKEDKLCWEIKTPEFILFHQWFVAKLQQIPYGEVHQRTEKVG